MAKKRISPWLAYLTDITENRRKIEYQNTQLNRRNYAWSIFAFYELTLGSLKSTTKNILMNSFFLKKEFDFNAIIPFLDDLPELNNKGDFRKRPQTPNFSGLVAFALKVLVITSEDCDDFRQDEGWHHFQRSIEIRDRMIAPKLDQDVLVSDEDLQHLESGYNWWIQTLESFFRYEDHFQEKFDELNNESGCDQR